MGGTTQILTSILDVEHVLQVAMTELKLIRTFDRIESLKDGGRWSFRQPKKQRGVGGLVKTHWDYLMDEMVRYSPKPHCRC